jgi:hypothetical protein
VFSLLSAVASEFLLTHVTHFYWVRTMCQTTILLSGTQGDQTPRKTENINSRSSGDKGSEGSTAEKVEVWVCSGSGERGSREETASAKALLWAMSQR